MFKKLNKMGKGIIVLFVLVLLFSMVTPGECVDTTRLGNKNSSGLYRIAIDTDGIVTFQADTAIKFPYDSGTTNDTLTAADTGREYVVTSGATSAVYLSLPAAAVGMVFPITSATTQAIYIDPNGTDIINYASLSAGDAIYNSSAAKGDSIKFVCVTANEWTVKPLVGTWADAN